MLRTALEKDTRVTPDLILPYDGVQPDFVSRPVWCGRGSTVIGAARIGAQAWIGDEAVIRADGQTVILGDRFWLGHRSTVHIATRTHGTGSATASRSGATASCTPARSAPTWSSRTTW